MRNRIPEVAEVAVIEDFYRGSNDSAFVRAILQKASTTSERLFREAGLYITADERAQDLIGETKPAPRFPPPWPITAVWPSARASPLPCALARAARKPLPLPNRCRHHSRGPRARGIFLTPPTSSPTALAQPLSPLVLSIPPPPPSPSLPWHDSLPPPRARLGVAHPGTTRDPVQLGAAVALVTVPAPSLLCWCSSRPRCGPARCTWPPALANAARGHDAVRAPPAPVPARGPAPPRSGRRSSVRALAPASACPSPRLARPARRNGPDWPVHARGAQLGAASLPTRGPMANLLCAQRRHGSRCPRSASAARVAPAQLLAPLRVGQD
eukprot:XP_020407831.1 atherin-like [Zea mays]